MRRKQMIPCEQVGQIDALRKMLSGNGNPEQGLIFKVAKIMDATDHIRTDIADIKDSVQKLALMYDTVFEAQVMTQSALEKYKAETVKFEEGKNYIKTQSHANSLKIIQIISITIAFIVMASGFYFAYKNLQNSTDKLNDKIDKMEVVK